MKAVILNISARMIVSLMDVLAKYLSTSMCLTKKNSWQYFMNWGRISSC